MYARIMKYFRKLLNTLSKYGWPATLVVLAGFALGFTWASSDELYKNIRLFDKVALMVSQNYVEKIDERELIETAIDGMLSELDQYTKYLDNADYIRLRQETDGHFCGVGIGLDYIEDTLTVITVLDGTSGKNAGIVSGDKIIKIDSTFTHGLDLKSIRMLIHGGEDSKVDLAVQGYNGIYREYSLVREEIEINPIPYFTVLENNVGYVKLAQFSEDCSEILKDALKNLIDDGVQSIVLDLRGNPGGLLIEAVKVSGLFLPDNSQIVQIRGRDDELLGEYYCFGKPLFPDGGLAVIVDRNTASAAEIVAGAIQDHDRGVVIGRDTYGKGLVQQVLQFSENSALKITTSKYYLPSGRCLQKQELFNEKPDEVTSIDSIYSTSIGRPVFGGGGITPDIEIGFTEDSELVSYLLSENAFFRYALEYCRENQIEDNYRFSNPDFAEFKNYCDSCFGDSYAGTAILDSIRNSFKKPDSNVINALYILNSEIENQVDSDFERYKVDIENELNNAIVSQIYSDDRDLYEYKVDNDIEISRAIEILADSEKYLAILASF